MASASISSSSKSPIIVTFICTMFLFVSVGESVPFNDTRFKPMEELKKLRRIRAHLKKINKPSVKTIESPDGDLIDCVVSHLQPAFDHPMLRGQRPLEPPFERPKGHNSSDEILERIQLWAESNEFCPDGTIPIRRATKKDILRANSLKRFGKKIRSVKHDTMNGGHEHAVGFVNGDRYYGAKANMNVWSPAVTEPYEFSLSQLWVISGSFDPRHGHWWLQFGSRMLIGYWPSFLFSHLQKHASMTQFGGEIVNTRSRGHHTSTQMGSGHFAHEGYGKAAYFRNLQVVDWGNSLLPLTNLHLLADHPNCYGIKAGKNNVWGNYTFYGGPGRNAGAVNREILHRIIFLFI